MTPTTDPTIYDEDSVFNTLFAAEKKPRTPTKAERMAQIFAEANTPEAPISVEDFLPVY